MRGRSPLRNPVTEWKLTTSCFCRALLLFLVTPAEGGREDVGTASAAAEGGRQARRAATEAREALVFVAEGARAAGRLCVAQHFGQLLHRLRRGRRGRSGCGWLLSRGPGDSGLARVDALARALRV